jgi:hypothetical protein
LNDDDRLLLVRIDERVKSIDQRLSRLEERVDKIFSKMSFNGLFGGRDGVKMITVIASLAGAISILVEVIRYLVVG